MKVTAVPFRSARPVLPILYMVKMRRERETKTSGSPTEPRGIDDIINTHTHTQRERERERERNGDGWLASSIYGYRYRHPDIDRWIAIYG